MVITQSCDLDHRKWIQIVPVFPASTLHPSKQASLRTNAINYLFYLPLDGTEEGYADLSQITAVHTSLCAARNASKEADESCHARTSEEVG